MKRAHCITKVSAEFAKIREYQHVRNLGFTAKYPKFIEMTLFAGIFVHNVILSCSCWKHDQTSRSSVNCILCDWCSFLNQNLILCAIFRSIWQHFVAWDSWSIPIQRGSQVQCHDQGRAKPWQGTVLHKIWNRQFLLWHKCPLLSEQRPQWYDSWEKYQ